MMVQRLNYVSIPHRYDTNTRKALEELGRDPVSIPHRYDTNVPLGMKLVPLDMFQSLIGTIQTWSVWGRFENFFSFNPS